jgi:phosphoglycerate dehydrogenase-like enzyme
MARGIGNRQKRIVAPRRVRGGERGVGKTRGRNAARPLRAEAQRRVLLLHEEVVAAYLPALRSFLPGWAFLVIPKDGDLPAGAQQTEVYLRFWDGRGGERLERLLDQAPNLQWVHTPSAGVDRLPLDRMAARSVRLTNGRGIHDVPIAETVFAYLLAFAKKLGEHRRFQKEHRWRQLRLGELSGKTLLLYGYGSIGREIASRARAFGLSVEAVRESGRAEDGLAAVYRPEDLVRAVARADIIVVAAPLTPRTRGSFGRPIYAAMKQGCWFVNVSRGQIVDEDALLEGLSRGRPECAALDVFAAEPLPEQSPLWDLENVWITPHDAWSSPHAKARSLELFVENLKRYLAGRPLRNQVDLERGW